MPFYEYQCRACGAHSEVLQKISDAPLRKCSECGKNQLTKLVSAPVFRLKGGGWYETDFKSDADKKRNLVGDKDDAPAKPAEADKAPEKKADEGAKEAAPSATPAVAPKPEKSPAKARPASARKPAKAPAKKRSGRR